VLHSSTNLCILVMQFSCTVCNLTRCTVFRN
jgi:hypothetical protein